MKIKNSSEGFTLPETLIVVFILVILSSLLLANARKPSWKFELARDAQIMVADARKAQNLAIAAQETTCGGQQKVPHYGFRTQTNLSGPTMYQVFADCNQNNRYDATNDNIVDSVTLTNTFVAHTFPSSGGPKYLEAVYIPPNPDLIVNAITANPDWVVRICHIKEPTNCRVFEGHKGGSIQLFGG